jgi:hypothetical protein
VTYHHLVFTLPHVLNPWVQIHDREIYAQLFEAVWATLRTFAADPKRFDGQLGMTAVLHTWGQTLTRHVHLHLPGARWGAVRARPLAPLSVPGAGALAAGARRLRQPPAPESVKGSSLALCIDSKQCLTNTEGISQCTKMRPANGNARETEDTPLDLLLWNRLEAGQSAKSGRLIDFWLSNVSAVTRSSVDIVVRSHIEPTFRPFRSRLSAIFSPLGT